MRRRNGTAGRGLIQHEVRGAPNIFFRETNIADRRIVSFASKRTAKHARARIQRIHIPLGCYELKRGGC